MSARKLFADRTSVSERLKRRPRVGTIGGFEHYGSLPLPYIAKDRDPGNHSFRKQRLCVRNRLCSTCGYKIGGTVVFLVDQSVMLGIEQGVFRTIDDLVEPAQHEDCARAALRSCPHLAKPRVNARVYLLFCERYTWRDESDLGRIEQYIVEPANVSKVERACDGAIIFERPIGAA